MKPLRILTWLGVALLAAALPACKSNSSGKPRVAFVSNNPATFWTIAEAGCRKAESEFDVEVIFRKPAKGDPAVQQEILDNLRNQDIKAIAVSVIDPKGQQAHLNEMAARMPLLTQDNDAPKSNRLCYIGTNNYEAGRAVGKLVKEVLPGGGTIAIFVGDTAPLNARQRRQGLLDELAGAPSPDDINEVVSGPDGQAYGKYRLHRTYTDQPEGEDKATRNATDALGDLRNEKDVCLIGLWAYNPPTILTAVKDKIKNGQIEPGQVKIVGFDEDFTTLRGIEDGDIYATVVQDPYKFGYESVKMMASLARGDQSVVPASKAIFVPHRIITKNGGKDRLPAEKFRHDLQAILGAK
jgi:ribose transport system substrate-binding protein